jgi:hypothetical protein
MPWMTDERSRNAVEAKEHDAHAREQSQREAFQKKQHKAQQSGMMNPALRPRSGEGRRPMTASGNPRTENAKPLAKFAKNQTRVRTMVGPGDNAPMLS